MFKDSTNKTSNGHTVTSLPTIPNDATSFYVLVRRRSHAMHNSEIREKINHLKKKLGRRKRRSTESPPSSASESSSVSSESPPPKHARRRVIESESDSETDNVAKENENEDSAFSILGEDPTLDKIFGEDIHAHMAVRWNNILQKGIKKENRDEIIKNYLPLANCSFILPPKLNDEIKAAVQEPAVKRDVKLEQKQGQLGVGITCIGKAIDLGLNIPDKELRDQIIKHLGDSGQILTDLHYFDTQTRKSLLMRGLNKDTKDTIKDLPRDKLLFGEGVAELKALKACSRSAADIKVKSPEPPAARRQAKSNTPSTFHAPPAGTLNWRGSSRGYGTSTMTSGAYHEQRPVTPGTRRPQMSHRSQRARWS